MVGPGTIGHPGGDGPGRQIVDEELVFKSSFNSSDLERWFCSEKIDEMITQIILKSLYQTQDAKLPLHLS